MYANDVMRPERVAAMASGVLQSELQQCGLVGSHTPHRCKSAAWYRCTASAGTEMSVVGLFDARSRVVSSAQRQCQCVLWYEVSFVVTKSAWYVYQGTRTAQRSLLHTKKKPSPLFARQ